MPRRPDELRSHRWLGVENLRAFGHRSRLLQIGYDRADFAGKPVVGIVNTWSDANPCHVHLRTRADEVKRGVWQAGGFPLELPAMSLSETMMKPTTMLYRNLLAMETEELIRSQPIDGVVLLGGCDKTIPALLMGAISAGVPAIVFPAGPMLRGNWRGDVLGSGSDTWKYWDEKRAGNITEDDWHEIEGGIARSFGTCMTMGTAATMMSLVEALGFMLPGASSIPAADSAHPRMATATGRRIVEMIWEDLTPDKIVSPASLDNAIVAHAGLGGSTNAVIHLVAIARRAGIPLQIDRFDEIARRVPVIADIRPSGRLLMEDFFYAGGMRAFLDRLSDHLDLGCTTVSGKTLGDDISGAQVWHDETIRPLDRPVSPEGGVVVLRGNIAPDGAVMKASAADPRLLRHRGPVLAFESYDEMAA
ncbi:MAG: dihydroxy-acid dehydratase, partial [Candidatus Eremiobacteraeota bacterium]|nr:dihydroxy-acid dehydratase [Candidatus Eremiobacteraeota bacterium]